MDKIVLIAASLVTDAEVRAAKLGPRFGRLDPASQLALLAVESLRVDFDRWPRERTGVCLAARAGSLSTDVEFWKGRGAVGGPSPTLFAYTLPSAALGEIAIRHKLTGPNLCLAGGADSVLEEGADFLLRGEAEACVCVYVNAVSAAAAELIQEPPAVRAGAIFLAREGQGISVPAREIGRDIESLCAKFSDLKPANKPDHARLDH
jgi:3-oxoacyl-(acyl-carrier-protein) synthase